MLPLPCMLVCTFVCANRTRDRGCSKHPVFPAPSKREGEKFLQQTSGAIRRENAKSYPPILRLREPPNGCLEGRGDQPGHTTFRAWNPGLSPVTARPALISGSHISLW